MSFITVSIDYPFCVAALLFHPVLNIYHTPTFCFSRNCICRAKHVIIFGPNNYKEAEKFGKVLSTSTILNLRLFCAFQHLDGWCLLAMDCDVAFHQRLSFHRLHKQRSNRSRLLCLFSTVFWSSDSRQRPYVRRLLNVLISADMFHRKLLQASFCPLRPRIIRYQRQLSSPLGLVHQTKTER